MLPEQAAGADK